ncbi:MAG: Mrp/NBP35 family ATP-binding protein [Flavobacteriales bacterium]|nr:Mrp/NBP35 family ATP-binding protein [Flavobacteriales bacterium]
MTEEKVLEALSKVVEPDLKKDIVELGLVSDIKVDDQSIAFKVRISSPAMHSRRRMQEACEFAIERAFGKEIKVDCEIAVIEGGAEDSNLRRVMPGVKNIIAVASGKGGVGKSTVAANLAVGLAKRGFKVGMVDADVYGPSLPTMFDLVNEKPDVIDKEGKQYIEPLESHGVKVLSIGFFADVSQPIVWRGPMASKALNQMFNDAWWGELDYMVLDLPPGTGDVHLSIVQALPLTGAVIVSTPQDVALADARKGVAMFQLPSVNVPVIGMIENMAWFTPEELPNNKYYIFGKEGAKGLAEQLDVPLLGQLPLVQSIREAGDAGRPAILQEGTPVTEHLNGIIDNFVIEVDKRVANLPPTKPVEMTQG